ncbi:hypothetical protein LX36DRAFT_242193 [Colletotrichum falcatum]|nr:hypothetical protein LX36DRAFT_242193 [Colletotrichum falcatum]
MGSFNDGDGDSTNPSATFTAQLRRLRVPRGRSPRSTTGDCHRPILVVDEESGRAYFPDTIWASECDEPFAGTTTPLWKWHYISGALMDLASSGQRVSRHHIPRLHCRFCDGVGGRRPIVGR